MPPSDLMGSARAPPARLPWLSTVRENIGAGAPAPAVDTPMVRTPAGLIAGGRLAHPGATSGSSKNAATIRRAAVGDPEHLARNIEGSGARLAVESRFTRTLCIKAAAGRRSQPGGVMPSHRPDLPSQQLARQFGAIDIYLFDQIARGRFDARRRVLDAGCGHGRNLLWFLQNGYEVLALDSDPSAVAAVRACRRAWRRRSPPRTFSRARSTRCPGPMAAWTRLSRVRSCTLQPATIISAGW